MDEYLIGLLRLLRVRLLGTDAVLMCVSSKFRSYAQLFGIHHMLYVTVLDQYFLWSSHLLSCPWYRSMTVTSPVLS